jgi:ribosomal protein S18 acetylase RimI-like enzyme
MKIRKATPTDYLSIKKIADEALGTNYFNPETILNTKHEETWLISDIDGDCIGFLYGYTDKVQNIRVLKTIVTDTKQRKQGVGTELISSFIRSSFEEGYEQIDCVVWKYKDSENGIEKLLLKKGFRQTEIITDYWLEESRLTGFYCPVCGNPCRCTAAIFSLRVKELNVFI